MRGKGRRGEFAARPRQMYYPRWGIEEPPRRTNAHSLYRYGERGFLTRLIIPASDKRKYFAHGLSIGECAIIAAVIGFMALLVHVFGMGFDSYADLMGW